MPGNYARQSVRFPLNLMGFMCDLKLPAAGPEVLFIFSSLFDAMKTKTSLVYEDSRLFDL